MISNCAARFFLAIVLALACGGCDGCDGGSATDSASPAGASAKLSPEEKLAQDAVLAEIQKHWLKTADGWITARDGGSSFAPIPFLRQMRDISVQGVETWQLSEADKANGFEWAGEVSFKSSPCREVGEQGIVLDGLGTPMVNRQKGQWSQWIDFKPEGVKVNKRNGAWEVPTDTWMLRGKIPTDPDFASAGVSR